MISPVISMNLQAAVARGVIDVGVAERTAKRISKMEEAYLISDSKPRSFFWAALNIVLDNPEAYDELSVEELVIMANQRIEE
jgi:hypothetical protein